jgi:sugar/nucleoside kinase (ribokinase family)
LVIKRGSAGASLLTGSERIDSPAFPVEANLTVGAGDSFSAALLYGACRGWDPVEQVEGFPGR